MFKEATGEYKRVYHLINLAAKYGWHKPAHNAKSCLLSVFKGHMRINIYYTTMTIGTCLLHPVKGKTQLFRRNVTDIELEKIFQNPRVHTNKGYY